MLAADSRITRIILPKGPRTFHINIPPRLRQRCLHMFRTMALLYQRPTARLLQTTCSQIMHQLLRWRPPATTYALEILWIQMPPSGRLRRPLSGEGRESLCRYPPSHSPRRRNLRAQSRLHPIQVVGIMLSNDHQLAPLQVPSGLAFTALRE